MTKQPIKLSPTMQIAATASALNISTKDREEAKRKAEADRQQTPMPRDIKAALTAGM